MRAIYNRRQWSLCTCAECHTLNFVEPHGTTARCKRCQRETEHRSIPYAYRDVSGCYLMLTQAQLRAAFGSVNPTATRSSSK